MMTRLIALPMHHQVQVSALVDMDYTGYEELIRKIRSMLTYIL